MHTLAPILNTGFHDTTCKTQSTGQDSMASAIQPLGMFHSLHLGIHWERPTQLTGGGLSHDRIGRQVYQLADLGRHEG